MKLPEDAVTMKHYLNHDELPFIIIFRKIYDKNFLGEIVSSLVQNLQSVQFIQDISRPHLSSANQIGKMGVTKLRKFLNKQMKILKKYNSEAELNKIGVKK